MRYLDSLVGLSVLYLAQGVFASTKLDNSSTPLCRSLQEKSVADAEYHTSVTSWIQTRLDDFHDHYGSDSDVSFQDNLTSTYAPDVAASMAHCSPGELCSVCSSPALDSRSQTVQLVGTASSGISLCAPASSLTMASRLSVADSYRVISI